MTNPKKQEDEVKPVKELDVALEKLALAEKERDEYLGGWKRAKADFINFKKESGQNIAELSDMVKMSFAYSILPVLDALDESKSAGIEGLDNIANLLKGILENEKIEEIETKKGDSLNPEIHESIEGEGDIVAEILQKGYKYNSPIGEKIIRPTKVKVKN